jgi:hypothetical protein
MMNLVENACGIFGGELKIVIESEVLSELIDGPVIKMAQDAAGRFGILKPIISKHEPPTPVDEKGNVPNTFEELAKVANKKGAKYRKVVYLR